MTAPAAASISGPAPVPLSSTTPGPASASTATPGGTTGPGRLRRLRFPLLVALAVVAAAAVAAIASGGGSSGDLDPASGSPAGSRAVARILQRQGVQVTRTSDLAAAAAETGTLVVVHPALLTPRRLAGLTADAGHVVLVEPDQAALDAVAAQVRARGEAGAGVTAPQCAATDAAAGPARAGGYIYDVPADVRADVCFPARAVPGAGSLVELDGPGNGGNATVVVLGQADVLRNSSLADDANAALALRVLGHRRTLTWLVPDPARLPPAGPESLRDLLPPWLGWVAVQGGIALLLALLWRARRMGPLVREPLPVVVRAGEALQGRARLYRGARAVDRAAATLRTAVLRRLARRLAVPPDAEPDAVAVRAAEAAGTDLDDVRRVLIGAPPRDERELVELADALDGLERDVADGTHGDHREGRR